MSVKHYYKLPLKASALVSKQEHPVCNLKESIGHYIHLINTTYFGECTFDDTIGCVIWDVDFDNLKSTNRLRSVMVDSLKESLQLHETRLEQIRVDLKIKQEEIIAPNISNRIKKRIDLTIRGRIKKTNESFTYNEYFYIGPLSY